MRNIRFEFTCSRPVPLYAHLCNQYLKSHELEITVGLSKFTYFIEARGDLKSLGQLADQIAQDFLLSVWLTESTILLIDSPMGSRAPLIGNIADGEFCQECVPLFGDNQSSQFGDISLRCDYCQGQSRLPEEYIGLSYADISNLSDTLISHKQVTLPGTPAISLSLSPQANTCRDHLLICNPNSLNALFHLQEHHVLALSSIEKPWITARPVSDHSTLTAPLYNLRFAHNRLLIVICEKLRQRGITWVYFNSENLEAPLAWVESAWCQLKTASQNKPVYLPFTDMAEPLHDKACYLGTTANWDKGRINCATTPSTTDSEVTTIDRQDAATCALLAGNLEYNEQKNSAVLYFSRCNSSQIVTLDGKRNLELFFSFPELPSTGYDIYYHLEQSPQRQVIEKFKHNFPQDYMRLLDLNLAKPTDNLHTLWAIAAIILGLPAKDLSKKSLSDALISSAMAHRGANSPRIDYPLTRGEAHRSLNWCKTLGSLISFRLADDKDHHKLAYAMHDSLADFIANWIEHLDQNIGIGSVILAGDEFADQVLSQRISLRLGKNFALKVNRQLDIDGNNLAIGGLYLKKRRLSPQGANR
ncbi:NiFe hydrogenase [Shewanella sp. D64]|uniref:Kae1-like domain-containing protein n=1 Tax=unclassified Shewanella TaxID=196818 RepID=UPI0022BA51FB|nr:MULTISPECIES: NiFe hydrogenase [unclassified Shewanella]MEC4725374.1 NiFe hydrogenase [Shewanella sp. D64]MEC4735780.1 NiFe hydrogenase [Shewanella sp. E94]WBJ93248.1 NiFe hydrogenase [Shewanella sp. MTB7]